MKGKGGNGGFGGGGGSGEDKAGAGGAFGGNANSRLGGGGAALGGAIFNDAGNVAVSNSTFTNNFVTRGAGGRANPGDGSVPADNGADAGGAIFSMNGHLTVTNVTVSGNEGTGSGAGIVVYENGSSTSLTLNDTIMANNGAQECFLRGSVRMSGAGNLIMSNGSGGSFEACPGVVSSVDPQLGPLQHNIPGITPTMAIFTTSPAFNVADLATSLLTAQNGVTRPLLGGFDIGAFELCTFRPEQVCLGVLKPPDTAPLIIQSSSAGGTVNIPSGNYALNSVVVLTATPKPGYSFINWIGAVADPSNPSTTVTMNQSQTVIANFIAQPTTMAGNVIAKAGPGNARVWTLSLLNNGPGVTSGPAINSFTLVQMSGAACTPVIGNAFPLAVGDLAPAQTGTANLTIDFTGCAAAARFTAQFTYSANFGTVSGNVVRYNQFQ
jgi:hypothetical protein